MTYIFLLIRSVFYDAEQPYPSITRAISRCIVCMQRYPSIAQAISLAIWNDLISLCMEPILYHFKTLIFNPVVWVGVWFWVNDTCLFCGPLCYLPGHIFRFFASCTGPEEIVPVCTRGKRRKKKNKKNLKKKKKPAKKKKKSGNLMKRVQKNF